MLQSLVDKRREPPDKVAYPTDLTDQQWAVIEPLLPKAKWGGRPRKTEVRHVVDAILYLVKTGCHWRLIPSNFPPWRTVYEYYMTWQKTGTLRKIQRLLVQKARRKAGKKRLPTIAIMDSQSVKTGKMVSEDKGFDGGKRVKGRKRHIATDILGLIIGVHVTSANTHDKVGGRKIVQRLAKFVGDQGLKKVYADGGYGGMPFKLYARQKLGASVHISKNLGKRIGRFKPIRKRWIVERSLAWLGDYRRLDKDQERLTRNSVAMIRWASISFMLKRVFPTPTLSPSW